MTTASRSLHAAAIAALMTGAPSAASAQSATVAVTTDSLTGVVNPGQTIRVTTTVSWTGTPGFWTHGQFAGIRGSTINSPPPGGMPGSAGGAVTSDFTPGFLVAIGQPAGGDVVGVDVAGVPAFFTGGFLIPPWHRFEGIVIHAFDWTAPGSAGGAGVHTFDFVTPAIAPNARVFLNPASPAFTEMPTAFVGASIRVIPAPGAFLLLGLAAAGRRNRT